MSQFLRNSTLLVNKFGVISDATGLADLAEGEILFINALTQEKVAAGDTPADHPKIQIVRGGANGDHDFSAVIDSDNIDSWTKQAAVAPVKDQATYSIPNGELDGTPGPTKVGDIIEVVILNKSNKVWGSQRQDRRVLQVISVGKKTEDATAIVNAINADQYSSGMVTASIFATNLIQIDAKDVPYTGLNNFEMINFDSAINVISGGVTTSVPAIPAQGGPKPGSGNKEQVLDIERALKYSRGISNFTKFPTPIGATDSDVENQTYLMYQINHNDVHPSANLNKKIGSPLATILALPTGNASIAVVASILDVWLGAVEAETPTED